MIKEKEQQPLAADMVRIYNQFMDLMAQAGQAEPGYAEAFMNFVQQGEKDGSLSAKTKQLISIALGVTAHCQYCIAFHTKSAIEAGATRQEILEAALVAGVMGGGPAVAHLRYVIDACEQFGAE